MKKAAFVTVIGRPSAGKSTLINQLCGQRVAIVSPVPQTTRNAIRGIVNTDQGQLVLIDTPGVHLSDKKFNRRLTETAFRSAGEADIILYLLDASREPGDEEKKIAKQISEFILKDRTLESVENAPLVIAVNKMDLPRANFNKACLFIKEYFPFIEPEKIIPISAQEKQGMDSLLSMLFALSPLGNAFYPEDCYTDQEIDFRIAEVIRGAALPHLRQELPHSIYVEVADRELREAEQSAGQESCAAKKARLWVRAFLICERESQKGMIVGKGGKIIKAIGETARKELNRIFDWKVELDLRVKTGKDWRHNDMVLRKLLG